MKDYIDKDLARLRPVNQLRGKTARFRRKRITQIAKEQIDASDDLAFWELRPDALLRTADIAEGYENGCWVRVALWVPFAGTPLDKDPE